MVTLFAEAKVVKAPPDASLHISLDAETLDEVWPRQRGLPFRGLVADEPEESE